MKTTFNKLDNGTTIDDIKKTISKTNSEYIDKFLNYLKGYVTDVRILKYKYSLIRFADLVEKDFDKLTFDEVRTAGGIINNGDLSVKTKQDIISEIKTAFKFLFGKNQYFPETVAGLKPPKSKEKLRLPDEMLNEKMIYQSIKACSNSRDQFFISLIGLDGALRPVELMRMTWSWIKKDKYGYFIQIKTAKESGDKPTRCIRIIKSEPYFIKWSLEYPAEKNDDSFVFINLGNLKPMERGTYSALFKRLKKKLKINGRFYPYLMRHSLLTKMSKDPTISQPLLKQFAGHSLRSNTIAEYQHFGDDDLKDMQLKFNGLIKDKEKKKELDRKPIKCPKCNKSNEYDSEFCHFCNMALSQKRQVESNERLEYLEKQLNEIKDLINFQSQLPEGTAKERAEKLVSDKKEIDFLHDLKQLKKKYKKKIK